MDFEEGDKITLKTECSGGQPGKIYILIEDEIFDPEEGEEGYQLMAMDPETEETTCSCQNNWTLVSKKRKPKKEPKKENNKNFINLGRVFNF